jgi:toxin-antitoxin system PIN domain toxin
VIAIDTNVLVYARREETEQHEAALEILRGLAEGDEPWALPWPCVYEYLRVVSHSLVFDPPTDPVQALEDVESLMRSPSIVMLGEGPGHAGHMRRAILSGKTSGNMVFDAHIAALLLEHGVTTIVTADRDFSRFADLEVTDPF